MPTKLRVALTGVKESVWNATLVIVVEPVGMSAKLDTAEFDNAYAVVRIGTGKERGSQKAVVVIPVAVPKTANTELAPMAAAVGDVI